MTILPFRRATSSHISASPMTDEQIAKVAPAAFAPSAHGSRSKRYVHVPTQDLLTAFRDNGFYPYSAQSAKIRKSADQTRNGFQKHIIRFRAANQMTEEARYGREIGDLVPEVLLLNSHDGSSSYELMSGVFKFACANGLIVADSVIGCIRVHHTGKVLENLVGGALEIAAQSGRVVERAAAMRGLTMPQHRMASFAEQALALRWPDEAPISHLTLLNARRREDADNTLWNVFNRAQEALVRGGNSYASVDEEGRVTMRRTRPINGIAQSVEINKGLWQLAERELDSRIAA